MGNISRRNFLKQVSVLGAMAATAGVAASPFVAVAGDETTRGEGNVEVKHAWCQMCTVAKAYCGTLCTVEDGRFVHVEGNPLAGNNAGRGTKTLCAKGNTAPALVYDPLRILYPMKRVGEKGDGKFERITWDEALDTIAAKMSEAKEKYGPESFMILTPQSAECIDTFGIRFLNAFGSPNFCHNGICWDQRETAKILALGQCPVQPGQMDKTKLLINWGANCENSAINQAAGMNYDKLRNHERGMKMIDIRPMLDPMGAHSDIWVPIRPGTDGALALAILNVIIGEDLYDHDFVENWCNGFDKLAEHVKQFTPEWAAEKTGLDVEQIYTVARMMGTEKPMAMFDGNGFGDQTNDGFWTAHSIFLIFAITGNLDIPGGCGAGMVMPPALIELNKSGFMNPAMWLQEMQPESDVDRERGYQPGAGQLVAPEFPRWFYGPAGSTIQSRTFSLSSGSQRALEALDTEVPYKPRVVFAHATNPLSSLRQPKRVAELLKKADFFFAMDMYWNPSCDYADIVLPACTQYETSDVLEMSNQTSGTFLALSQKLVEPLGESKSDYAIYPLLAERLGLGEYMWNGDSDGFLREMLEPSGYTVEDLRNAPQGIFVERTDGAMPVEPEYRRYEELFKYLPHGKVPCYHEAIGGKQDNLDKGTLGFLPEYSGPAQGLAETPELAKEYPLIFSDVHSHRLAQHSHKISLPWLREIKPYPWCKINPETAQKYGIADGDWMKIESPFGWVVLVAEYFEAISPEVLMSRRGWWQKCEELGLPGYGCFDGGSEINALYEWAPEKWDKFCSSASKQTLVKISKWEG